ncbi:MAG: carboxypeptidase-like regulatory domain-containing protein, partial [Acidobacteriota bacterium]|nr:carboxypeptidase-like regulatory domain-containing protein [Acidobacteriota bacterium]
MRLRLVVSLLLFVSAPAIAQSTAGLAAISGVVRDASGAAVPKARVSITSDSRGAARAVNTNNGGVFAAPSLAPGSDYKVTVAAPGYDTYEVKDLNLQVGQNLNL